MATLRKILTSEEIKISQMRGIDVDKLIKDLTINELRNLSFILIRYKAGYVSADVLTCILRRCVVRKIEVF